MNTISLAAPSLTNATPLELIDAAAAAGFAGVGLRLARSRFLEQPFYPVVGDAPLIARIRRRIRDSGLSILEVYSFYMTAEVDFEAFEAAMEIGAEFGAKYVVALGYDPDWARCCDTFAKFCDIARPFGLTVAIEFAPVEQCCPATLEQALRLVKEVDRSNSAIMPDPAHLRRSGGAISDLRAIEPRYLRFSQICDLEPTGEEFLPGLGRTVVTLRRRMLGEGTLSVLEWLAALPSGVPLSVECVPQPQGTSHTQWAKALYASTRRALDDYYATLRSRPGAPER